MLTGDSPEEFFTSNGFVRIEHFYSPTLLYTIGYIKALLARAEAEAPSLI